MAAAEGRLYEAAGPCQREGCGAADADDPQLSVYADEIRAGGGYLSQPKPEVAGELPKGRVATIITGLPVWYPRHLLFAKIAEIGKQQPLYAAMYECAACAQSKGTAFAVWPEKKCGVILAQKLQGIGAPDGKKVYPVHVEVCFGPAIDAYAGVGPLPNLGPKLCDGTTASLARTRGYSVLDRRALDQLVADRNKAKKEAREKLEKERKAAAEVKARGSGGTSDVKQTSVTDLLTAAAQQSRGRPGSPARQQQPNAEGRPARRTKGQSRDAEDSDSSGGERDRGRDRKRGREGGAREHRSSARPRHK
eukprot:TRINITY_DN22124_c0_g1_i1.p1 TRINITY_DN22124_c0_g1~~TRINITY_DN22124_c0_g1_i1.p1  ORF type:complete len:334 (+),score=76.03 TRINITY_DN22124_c0_g1_i1:84-1004(+)